MQTHDTFSFANLGLVRRLTFAALNGQAEDTRSILGEMAKPEIKSVVTLWQHAKTTVQSLANDVIIKGHSAIFQMMRGWMLDENCFDEHRAKYLDTASCTGNLDLLKTLIDESDDLEFILRDAAFAGHDHIIGWLIQKYDAFNTQFFGFNTAIAIACARGHKRCLRKLLMHKMKHFMGPALIDAVKFGDRHVATLALGSSACKDSDKGMALVCAVNNGNHDMMRLIMGFMSVELLNDGNALMMAVSLDDDDATRLLCEFGTRTDIFDGEALHIAAMNGNLNIIKTLLNSSHPPRVDNKALWAAAGGRHKEVMKFLVNFKRA